MENVVISIENVGKQYRLGQVGTNSLAQDLNRFWHSVRGKEDPYLKIGDVNDRTKKGGSDLVWALKDISFDVKQGEVLGIIGKNGAGKSTLLKILSRVTGPTVGEIKVKGRIASLLEVGTGFHPDLSGKENIFLNGAILGMSRQEIKSKLDEIIAFSGIEKYIDTPVKRYSSGMYVRLAFAVAAHLDPEILIIDEVLAVGDAEFQKKCLSKMKDVSGQGRTVLFVSHNLTAIKGLCNKAAFLKHGTLQQSGETSKIIDAYLSNEITQNISYKWDSNNEAPGNEFQKILRYEIILSDKKGTNLILTKESFDIEFELENLIEGTVNLVLNVYNIEELCIFATTSPSTNLKKGKTTYTCHFPKNFFNDGIYTFSMMVVRNGGSQGTMFIHEKLSIEFTEERIGSAWHGKWPGIIRPFFNWDIK